MLVIIVATDNRLTDPHVGPKDAATTFQAHSNWSKLRESESTNAELNACPMRSDQTSPRTAASGHAALEPPQALTHTQHQ